MNVGISEEMSVDAPVTQYVIALSFFSSFLSLSLFLCQIVSPNTVSPFS